MAVAAYGAGEHWVTDDEPVEPSSRVSRAPARAASPYDWDGRTENMGDVVEEMPIYNTRVPCTQFVQQVLTAGGYDTTVKVPGTRYSVKDVINLNMIPAEDIRSELKNDNPLMKGVVYALSQTGQGEEISPNEVQKGDIVQYYYFDDSWKGHTAIVTETSRIGVLLKGSQRTGVGHMRVKFENFDKVYAVRPKAK